MNGSTRERIMITLLPTLLAVLVWYGLMRPSRQYQQRTASAEKAKTEMISPNALLIAKSTGEKLKGDLANLEREKTVGLDAWKILQGKLVTATDRAAKLERVSDLLRGKGLTIVAETTVDGQSVPRIAPLEEARRKLTQPAETLFPDLFEKAQPRQSTQDTAQRNAVRIELIGTYNQIRAALTELRQTEPEIVPAQLAMDEPKTSSPKRKWMLTLSL